jgi:hypothetical protein
MMERLPTAGFVAPFVALCFTKIWFDFAIIAQTKYTAQDYYLDVPHWWGQMGLDDARWISVGLLPAIVCRFFGFAVIVIGVARRSSAGLISGAWSLILAAAVGFVHMAATF